LTNPVYITSRPPVHMGF